MTKTEYFEALRNELLEKHRRSIQAHIDKDVEHLIQDMSPNFFSISDAEITYPSKEDERKKFSEYLNHTTFTQYSDLVEPAIGFSDDASIAWMNVKVKVTGINKEANDDSERFEFVCAWLTLYRRINDEWQKLGEVSTWK